MAKELLEQQLLDFSGGLNDSLNRLLLQDNESPSLSNVFVNKSGAVEKRYGCVIGTNKPYANTETRVFGFLSVAAITADVVLASDGTTIQRRTGGSSSGTWDYVGFATGTATFTNASATVSRSTGAVDWRTQMRAGDTIRLDADGTFYTIQSVDSATQITLTGSFAGSTATGAFTERQNLQSAFGGPDAVMFKDKLYIGPANSPSTGTSGLMTFDGTETRRVASSTVLNTMVRHKTYIFGVNNKNSSTPSRVFWCDNLDPDTWPASNFADVSPNDGSTARGLVSHNDLLYVFKDNSIFYFVGEVFDPSNPTYALRRIINPGNIGTMQGRTCKVFQDQIIFLGQDGIYALQGTSKIANISLEKIDSTVRTILNRAVQAASGSFGNACAEVYDNMYWLSCQTGAAATTNDTLIILDNKGAWTKHTPDVADFRLIRISGDPGLTLVASDAITGAIMTFDGTGLDDGSTAITSTWSSRLLTFGDFARSTHVVDLYVAYQNTTGQAAKISIFDDSGQIGSTLTHTFPGGSTQFITVQRIPVERDTMGFYFTLTSNTLSTGCRMVGAMITYRKEARGSAKVVT